MFFVMDFVALLSGGKDSCSNIYLSIQHGHRLACVANLHPTEEGEHELNSFMYQSAGSTLIPAIADCLGVPLLRKPIKRLANDQTLEYAVSENTEDEVEDLYDLLAQVQQEYPRIRAVSVGAIVSNYQRHRVEAVCQRLGLVVLAYLWQRDRMELIREIVDRGFECILVKV
ncbi:diphthine--ammonia ligase [archaeon]|nr:MAG: diphthine--ammonia ligase [archaeon]